jgi:hypothetical protein
VLVKRGGECKVVHLKHGGSEEEELARSEGDPVRWYYRVRLNGADHQWGKDPPKEVVG